MLKGAGVSDTQFGIEGAGGGFFAFL